MNTFADYGIDLGGRSGVEVQATCPKCSHTRKKSKARCLSVNTTMGVWVCHHCSWAGSLKQGEQAKAKFTVKPHYRPPDELPQAAIEFFEARKISQDTIRRMKIGLQPAYMKEFEEEISCLAFPYFRQGETINIKYRGLMQKVFRQVTHAEKIFYNLDSLANQSEAVVVEGEIDALSLMEAGIDNVVSVPDGAPPANSKASDQKFEYLPNCHKWLDPLTKIVLAVDGDGPGRTLEAELARRLGPERCWRVQWPDDCRDANDVLLKYGPAELNRLILESKPYPLEGVLEVTDVAEDVMDLYEHGLPRGNSTGLPSVDELYTVKPGEVTIVTGIPSHGKSEWLDWLMVQLAMLHGWVFAVCSPENFPVSRHIAPLTEKYLGLPFRAGPTERMNPAQLQAALQWVQDHFVFIAPEETITVDSLLSTAKNLVTRRGIRGLLIDPWNEFDHRRPSNISETEYISYCLGKIRRFARRHGVHVWISAHPQKLYRREDGSYPVPTPYDIAGSAHWRNKADNCLTIWRDELEPDCPVKLFVQKIRFKEVGKVGVVELTWNKLSGRYEEIVEEPCWN